MQASNSLTSFLSLPAVCNGDGDVGHWRCTLCQAVRQLDTNCLQEGRGVSLLSTAFPSLQAWRAWQSWPECTCKPSSQATPVTKQETTAPRGSSAVSSGDGFQARVIWSAWCVQCCGLTLHTAGSK